MEFFEKFGIDVKLLIAQIINFSILLFLLYRFLYKPILKILKERSQKIEKSLKEAEKIEEELKQAEEVKAERILQAQKEAYNIIKKAEKEAHKIREEILAQTQKEISVLREKAEEEIKKKKKLLIEETRREIADLIILASQKMLIEKWDREKDKKFVEKILEEINNA